MTRTEIIEELKIILIGLASFIRSYIVPAIVFLYVTGEFVVESVKDKTKLKDSWTSFTTFIQHNQWN